MNNDLMDYEKALTTLAQNNVSHEFSNTDDHHALIVFKNIFTSAKECIRIACGCLNDKFTSNNQYLDSLQTFLNKDGVKLKIILTDCSCTANFLQSKIGQLLITHSSKVEIKTTSDYFYNEDSQVHFCVGDNRMFRFETDIQNREAFGNFNDKDISLKLIKTFEKSFSSDNAINLPLIK